MGDHAKIYSPSASMAWLHCPASPRISADLPNSTSNYSLEGRDAHSQAEWSLGSREGEPPYPQYDTDLRLYYELVAEYAATGTLMVETVVEFSEWCPEGFGTADAVIIDGQKVIIIDLKFGKGERVEAVNNSQMRLYALGVLQKLQFQYALDTVEMVICQPRLDHVSSETVTALELLEWGDWVKTRVDEVQNPDAVAVPGRQQCRWCRARNTCKARALDILAGWEHELLVSEHVAQLLDVVPALKAWCRGVEEEAQRMALDGQTIEGYKLVEGRSTRKFNDDAAKILSAQGLDEDQIYQPRKLATLGNVEKALGGKKKSADVMKQCTFKPVGKPTLVKNSDKRPEISSNQVAQFPLGA